MYNILISGYYGFDNIGDESILRTLVTSLRERIPDCSLTVLSHDPAATREKYGVEAVERMSPLAIARAVRRCDMLISGGGSLLQDVTSSKSLHYYLAIIRFAQLLGKKVFIYSQGIGPIEKDADRRATARALRRADGIVVQDDFNKAQDAPDGVGVAIYHTASGETVMAVCSLDRRSGGAGRHHGGPGHPHEKDGQGGGGDHPPPRGRDAGRSSRGRLGHPRAEPGQPLCRGGPALDPMAEGDLQRAVGAHPIPL